MNIVSMKVWSDALREQVSIASDRVAAGKEKAKAPCTKHARHVWKEWRSLWDPSRKEWGGQECDCGALKFYTLTLE